MTCRTPIPSRESERRGFVESNLSGVVMRGVHIAGSDIDAPWLLEGGSVLRVNGIDVAPFVEAELNRRFPGHADRRAADPDGLLAAWAGSPPRGHGLTGEDPRVG